MAANVVDKDTNAGETSLGGSEDSSDYSIDVWGDDGKTFPDNEFTDARILRCDDTDLRKHHSQIMRERKLASAQQTAVKITEILEGGGGHDIDPTVIETVELELSKAKDLSTQVDESSKMSQDLPAKEERR